MNSAGTFIDILQECKRKNKKILGVRKLSRPATECDLSRCFANFAPCLCLLHGHMYSSRISFFFSRQRIYFSLEIDTLSLECSFRLYLKVIKNGEAHKCLIKTHLLCACRSTPMSLCRVRWNQASSYR